MGAVDEAAPSGGLDATDEHVARPPPPRPSCSRAAAPGSTGSSSTSVQSYRMQLRRSASSGLLVSPMAGLEPRRGCAAPPPISTSPGEPGSLSRGAVLDADSTALRSGMPPNEVGTSASQQAAELLVSSAVGLAEAASRATISVRAAARAALVIQKESRRMLEGRGVRRARTAVVDAVPDE
jgi:hypothetical protein